MSKTYSALKKLIDSKKAKICVVGLGYVGLPIAVEFSKKGFFVFGYDTKKSRVDGLKKGKSHIDDIEDKDIKKIVGKKFHPTYKAEVLNTADVIIVCVPTPLRKRKIPNISYIIKATRSIAEYLRKGQLIVLESTTYPGTTRDVMQPILTKKGLKEGRDFYLSFSPERIDPGNKKYSFSNIPKVVGGVSKETTILAEKLYSKVVDKVVKVSSLESAEVVKLLENTFRIVNIGLINEFAMLCDKLKINVWEVVEAAKTKPFGFMPFYPGPGLGGHCLAEGESIFIENKNGVETSTIKSFVDKVSQDPKSSVKNLRNGLYIKPSSGYKMLTYDVDSNKSKFSNITMLSKRYVDNDIYKIITTDNRKVSVTDMHPMMVNDGTELKVKFAKDLDIGDQIPFASIVDYKKLRSNSRSLSIDLIEEFQSRPEFFDKIRVRSKNFLWQDYKGLIYKIDFDNPYYHDYIRYNYLPLKYYLELERKKLLHVKHSDLLLCTGRGPSLNEIPAVVRIDSDFCRLVGYYLSEGCITKDKSLRTRFSFNSNELEYIDDVCAILKTIGVRYSIYNSKRCNSSCIKVSSDIFGILFRDILSCGINCYNMNIPDRFFIIPERYKWELLKGLLRGDGGVDWKLSKRCYIKNNKEYNHHHNSCGVNYFSSSKKLFQQVVLLLQGFGIVPTFKKREGLLYIFGYKQIFKLRDIFLGDKKAKVESYFRNNQKIIKNKGFKKYKGFITSEVKNITKIKGGYVYSAEINDTHTIVTSYGAIVHNCIPADPLYLSWKARKVGFKTKMIDLAAKTNLFMPHYVVSRIEAMLSKKKISVSKARILILGVTYKKDVKDLRESPALDIIDILTKKKAKVSYSDPYIPYLDIDSIKLKSTKISKENIKKHDLVVLVTAHAKFNYSMIARNAKLIFDTRNGFKNIASKKENIIKL